MNVTVVSEWLGIIAGITLVAGWIWKITKWFREKIISAERSAKLGEELVSELLSRATSPARRADIHSFIQFRCIQTEAGITRHIILSILIGCIIAFIGILLIIADRFIDTSVAPWMWRFSIASYAVAIIFFAIVLFFIRQLHVINHAWNKRAENVLKDRAFKHVET